MLHLTVIFILIVIKAETAQQAASEKFEHISEVAKQGKQVL